MPRLMMFGDRRARRSLARRNYQICSERICIRATELPTASTRSTVTASQVHSPQKSSGCATLVAMVQGEEFKFQCGAAAHPEREQGADSGQNVSIPMTV